MRTAAICPTCATYENALCVLYNGDYLPAIDVEPLDSLQTALEKIDTTIANMPTGTSGTSGSSGLNGTSGTNGSAGVAGTSGTNGSAGIAGSAGSNGTSGSSGITPGGSLEYISFAYEGAAPQFTLVSLPQQKVSFCGTEIDGGTVWADFTFNYNLYNYLVGTTSLTFSNMETLRSIYNVSFTSNDMITLSFPNLKISLSYFFIGGNNLETVNLSNLVFSDSLEVSYAIKLTTLSLPSFKYTRNLKVLNNDLLVSVDLSSLESVTTTQFQFFGNPLLTTITLTSALKRVGVNFDGRNCALSEATVDNILVRLAALDGTAGTTSYNTKTVNLSGGTNATPSATGLAAKAILESRGCTVTVN